MPTYRAPISEFRFILNDLFNAPALWARLPTVADTLDIETANAILEEASKLTEDLLAPLNRIGDEEGAQWRDGIVSTPTGFKEAWSTYIAGGWVGLCGNQAFGGLGMPKMLSVMFEEMLYAANTSFALYSSLTSGACLAIDAHASQDLKEQYLPAMYEGRWAGAMCLTEPHAGSDLGLIRTKAIPKDQGTYAITGTKIFITGGEQDLSENIIHLVLAKLPDAPPGAKGISLFLVPKILVDGAGDLVNQNGVRCGSIEHKMGIKASATCEMNFQDATGWLVGEPHKGLAAMFTMMNYERLSIGIQGLGCADASYQGALAYARDRTQGRAPSASGTEGPAPIIHHADVRRMLLTIKAMTEGGRAFAGYVGLQLDLAKFSPDDAERRRSADIAALLTPVAKAFLTDTGLDSCVLGQQVFGGHGYIRESGQEQLVRDVRIAQIYEGTNGVQALDLLGRKVMADKAVTLMKFCADVRAFLPIAPSRFAAPLADAVGRLERVTHSLLDRCAANPDEVGSASVDYLNLVGYVSYAWLWARMAAVAESHPNANFDFYQSKIATADFFFQKLLPRTLTLEATICAGAGPLFKHHADKL